MQLFVTILHIILCFSLILIILLQPGKEGAAAFGGGGANQMYGPRGSGHVLGRATTLVAGLFMFTSITLAWYSSERAQTDSDLEEGIDQLDQEGEGFEIDAPTPTPGAPVPAPAPDLAPSGSLAPTNPAAAPTDSLAAPAGTGAIEALGMDPAPAPAPTTPGPADPAGGGATP